MNILLADEDSRVRSALKLVLSQETSKPSIHECSDMESLILQAKTQNPDLVILDWDLLGKPTDLLLYGLKGNVCRTKVIVLGRRQEVGGHALACGADAFFCKADSPELLLTAIRVIFTDRNMDITHTIE
jgi:DNA-binding NarL/FixJ family response regulator